jgi:molybdopterin molybdotransferase
MVEHTDRVGDELEVFDAVPAGENVAPVGEDVEAGQPLFDAGHRLRPSDLGLLKSTGLAAVEVVEPPAVGVVPTGEELVQADPGPGEVIETNGMTVTQLVARWGGEPAYRDVVTDDEDALRSAIERDLDKDLVVTTGGSSVGERDLLPDVVASMGEVAFHGVALRPGHPVAVGVVEGTPVVMLPGYPVSTLVNAVQLLRPAVKWAGGMPLPDLPSVEARLARKVRSEPGVRTFARVTSEERDGERVAVPTRASGAGVLSSVALADGWVVVPESREGIPTGEAVAVEDWEWSA